MAYNKNSKPEEFMFIDSDDDEVLTDDLSVDDEEDDLISITNKEYCELLDYKKKYLSLLKQMKVEIEKEKLKKKPVEVKAEVKKTPVVVKAEVKKISVIVKPEVKKTPVVVKPVKLISQVVEKTCISCYHEYEQDTVDKELYCENCLNNPKNLITCKGKTKQGHNCKCKTLYYNKLCLYHYMTKCYYCLTELKEGDHVKCETITKAVGEKRKKVGQRMEAQCMYNNKGTVANICHNCFDDGKLKIRLWKPQRDKMSYSDDEDEIEKLISEYEGEEEFIF